MNSWIRQISKTSLKLVWNPESLFFDEFDHLTRVRQWWDSVLQVWPIFSLNWAKSLLLSPNWQHIPVLQFWHGFCMFCASKHGKWSHSCWRQGQNTWGSNYFLLVVRILLSMTIQWQWIWRKKRQRSARLVYELWKVKVDPQWESCQLEKRKR